MFLFQGTNTWPIRCSNSLLHPPQPKLVVTWCGHEKSTWNRRHEQRVQEFMVFLTVRPSSCGCDASNSSGLLSEGATPVGQELFVRKKVSLERVSMLRLLRLLAVKPGIHDECWNWQRSFCGTRLKTLCGIGHPQERFGKMEAV